MDDAYRYAKTPKEADYAAEQTEQYREIGAHLVKDIARSPYDKHYICIRCGMEERWKEGEHQGGRDDYLEKRECCR